ncbi:MAG: zinc ribbon domain-containing protein [Elusimicrobiales bacterium]|nr:zinc ribbon domain-containing protein [Elusimicrobiales bacterium]
MKCPKCGGDNSDEAVFCSLCYAPFTKKENEAASPNEPPSMSPGPEPVRVSPAPVNYNSETGGGSGLLKFFVIGIVIAGGYFAYKNVTPSFSVSIDETPIVVPETVAEKMQLAGKLLDDHDKARLAFLAELEKTKLNIKGFGPSGKYWKTYKKLEDNYLDKFNSLNLPCPQTQAAHNEPGYVEWSQYHAGRASEMLNKFNQRYKQLIDKTARSAYPSK